MPPQVSWLNPDASLGLSQMRYHHLVKGFQSRLFGSVLRSWYETYKYLEFRDVRQVMDPFIT
jgi:hypothetical protein